MSVYYEEQKRREAEAARRNTQAQQNRGSRMADINRDTHFLRFF